MPLNNVKPNAIIKIIKNMGNIKLKKSNGNTSSPPVCIKDIFVLLYISASIYTRRAEKIPSIKRGFPIFYRFSKD